MLIAGCMQRMKCQRSSDTNSNFRTNMYLDILGLYEWRFDHSLQNFSRQIIANFYKTYTWYSKKDIVQ